MKFNEKLRVLLKDREWTQRKLADCMNVSESTVQKWVTGKNKPKIDDCWELGKIFSMTVDDLFDLDLKVIENPEYFVIDSYIPYAPVDDRDSIHTIIDADLGEGTFLHRFENPGGVPYSAIYEHRKEVFSCPREDEINMIKAWNKNRGVRWTR